MGLLKEVISSPSVVASFESDSVPILDLKQLAYDEGRRDEKMIAETGTWQSLHVFINQFLIIDVLLMARFLLFFAQLRTEF